MKKRGFTLVELLAVIAILAILVIIALPNVMGMFNTAKENSFKTEIKEIYKTAQQTWIQDSMFGNTEKTYSRCKSGCSNSLDLTGRTELEYFIKINQSGKVTEYYATDGTFQYSYSDGDLKIENITDVQKVANIENSDDLVVINGTTNNNSNEPTFFATDSWSVIINAIRNNNTSAYNVGDTRQIDLADLGTHTIRIANKSTPSECNNAGFSQTACGFVIEFADIIDSKRMNPYSSEGTVNGDGNKGSWQYSEMRTYLNTTIINKLPTDLKSIILDTYVVSGYGLSDSSNFITTDKLYLLSSHEVWEDVDGNSSNGIDNADTSYNKTRQLDYYKNLNVTNSNYSSAVKINNINPGYWWLRSASHYSYEGESKAFSCVENTGSWMINKSSNDRGVSPAFRIG